MGMIHPNVLNFPKPRLGLLVDTRVLDWSSNAAGVQGVLEQGEHMSPDHRRADCPGSRLDGNRGASGSRCTCSCAGSILVTGPP